MGKKSSTKKGYDVKIISFTGLPYNDFNGAAVKKHEAEAFRESFRLAALRLTPKDFLSTRDRVLKLAKEKLR